MNHPRVEKVINEFAQFSNWEDRYKKMIEVGKQLEIMPENLKTEENKVKGCQSQVWLWGEVRGGKVHFWADSDALIVKGLVTVLLQVYNDLSPQEILSISPDFIKELGFDKNLSPSRTNGLFSMLKQIRIYAMAFAYKQG